MNTHWRYHKKPAKNIFKHIGWVIIILTVIAFWVIFFLVLFTEDDGKMALIEERLDILSEKPCDRVESIRKVKYSVVRVVGGEGEGSGFVFNPEGLILTNFHVIEFEPAPKIIFSNNTFETGEIVMADKASDLAVIKIKKKLPYAPLSYSGYLYVGDELIALGYPFGGGLPGEVSVSVGSLAARRDFKEEDIDYLQLDKSLIPGVSGGPMITACGNVVGINTATLSGAGLAMTSETIEKRYAVMEELDDPLQDIEKITFEPNRSPLDAVSSFYNYLKIRQMEKAFSLLSENFKQGYGYDLWIIGYQSLLDTSVIKIEADEKNDKIIYVKLSTKDFVDDGIQYRYFKGQWEVRKIDDKWLLWDPNIKEVENRWELFYDI